MIDPSNLSSSEHQAVVGASEDGRVETANEGVDRGFMAGGGEMGALMRSMDWSRTSFGPVSGWSQALKAAVSICLTTRFPIVLYYGRDLALIYNDAWRPVVGNKHPWSFGRAGHEVWAEIWDIIGPMFQTVMDTGEATWSDDQLLPLNRFGYVEECYFYYSYSPIRGDGGRVEGIFTAVTETTVRVLSDRRTRLLRDLAARSLEAKSAEEACAVTAEVLVSDPHDVPFAFLYLCNGDGSMHRTASVGTGEPGILAPESVSPDPGAGDDWGLVAVWTEGEAGLVENLDGRWPDLPRGPWPERPSQAYVLPIGSSTAGTVGVIVIGISARVRFDDRYRSFCEQITSSLSSSLANAQAYQEERRRAERLAEIDRAKTAFFSNVSHEFRTPLTLMLSPLEEVLAKPDIDVLPDNRNLVGIAHRNGLRLLRLVNGLLDFSRVEAGRATARFDHTDLASFTADLAGNFRSLCEQAGLVLTVDCDALSEPAYVDQDMWEKIVLNLLSNAFKFTFEGGITVRLRQDEHTALLSVGDTGTGIPATELPKLFERFHRVEGAQGRSFEGSGIGLALVQELVKLHHGSIQVESEPGRGSTFVVALPLGKGHLPAESSGRSPALSSTAVRAEAFVEEARRWLGDAPDAFGGMVETIAEPETLTRECLTGGSVLLADDNADMREHVRRLLERQGYAVTVAANGRAALAAALATKPDLLLTDVMMPVLDGFGLLREVRAVPALREMPVIMLSARAGDEAKVEGLDAGADDYLTKPFSARELLARVGANLQLARVRREAAEALRRANEGLEREVEARTQERDRIWRNSGDGLLVSDANGVWLSVNPAWTRMLGWSESELVGRTSEWLEHPDDRERTRSEVARLAAGNKTLQFENRFRTRDGTYRTLSWTAVPEDDRFYCIARDVTEQRTREDELAQTAEALRQAQKMEAVGQLTGGIAHDFNNMLAGIIGSMDLLKRRIGQGRIGDVDRYIDAAVTSANRAAALTARLLAFGRRQSLDTKAADLNRLVTGLEDLLKRTLGEAVSLKTMLHADLWPALTDANQFESALLNMAINARDAMPNGGKLTIETRNIRLDSAYTRNYEGLEPGEYVSVCVSDTGTGMPPDVLKRAFDPFFTTKPIGQGTGLGLSMIYGFAKQSNGHVRIYSEVGQGTSVCIYMPRLLAEPVRETDEEKMDMPRGSGERVLVVEDDPALRMLVLETLADLGYQADDAEDAKSAIPRLEDGCRLDLLVTDVGLPNGMNGRQLAEVARSKRPDLPVLFITGYAEGAAVRGGFLDPGMDMITKPFALDVLALKIREMVTGQPAM